MISAVSYFQCFMNKILTGMQFIKYKLQRTMYTNNVQLKYIPKYVPIVSNRTYIYCTDELLVGHMELCHYAKNCSELGCNFFFYQTTEYLVHSSDCHIRQKPSASLLDLIAFWIWGAFYFQTNTEHHFQGTGGTQAFPRRSLKG